MLDRSGLEIAGAYSHDTQAGVREFRAASTEDPTAEADASYSFGREEDCRAVSRKLAEDVPSAEVRDEESGIFLNDDVARLSDNLAPP